MTNDNAESAQPATAASTPQKTQTPAAGKDKDDKATTTTTPARKVSGATPKSAPAGTRPRSNSKKPMEPPTLLTDFLLGRQSPARIAARRERVAAERERRKSVEAVKAELRHEMRQSAVKKVQPPGGVKERVKQWQKTNSAAMARGDPDDAATEPTDVAFNGDEIDSVTEEDRIRIKMRQKKKATGTGTKAKLATNTAGESADDDANAGPSNDGEPSPKTAPKKRVVSDDHWMKVKNRGRPLPRKVSTSARRRVSPRIRQKSPPRAQIPSDFTLRTAANPSVKNKINSWAKLVEIADTTPPRSFLSGRTGSVSSDDSRSEATSDTGSQTTAKRPRSKSRGADALRIKPIRKKLLDDDGIRVSPSDVSRAYENGPPRRTKTAAKVNKSGDGMKGSPSNMLKKKDDGIRVTGSDILKDDDGIRVTPSEMSKNGDDGSRVKASGAVKDDAAPSTLLTNEDGIRIRPSDISKNDDGIRITPSDFSKDDDGIRVTPSDVSKNNNDDGIRIRPLKPTQQDEEAKIRPTTSRSQVTTPKSQAKARPTSSHRQVPKPEVTDVTDDESDLSSELSSADGMPKDEKPSGALYSPGVSKTDREETPKKHKRGGLADTTPPKRKVSRSSRPSPKAKLKNRRSAHSDFPDDASWVDEGTELGPEHILGSDLATSLANKSVADLLGDIPFGNSAFSELEVPTNGGPLRTRPKQPKQQKRSGTDRKSSLKGMPGLLQKVMEEGKKMIQDMNEPPRPPAPNNPPSIEKWLNNTVDPFVEDEPQATPTKQQQTSSKQSTPPKPTTSMDQRSPETATQGTPESSKRSSSQLPVHDRTPESVRRRTPEHRSSREKIQRQPSRDYSSKRDNVREQRSRQSIHHSPYAYEVDASREAKLGRRVSHDSKASRRSRSSSHLETDISEESYAHSADMTDSTTRPHTPKKPRTPDTGLKRRSATRSSSSLKSGGKRPLLGLLKEAFQGESREYKKPALNYTTQEERMYEDGYDDEDDDDKTEDGRTVSNYDQGMSQNYEETVTGSEVSSEYSSEMLTPRMAGPRLRPPTNGHHELSTIMSEEASSAMESDVHTYVQQRQPQMTRTRSNLSRSTTTTTLSRNSGLSRSKRGGSGLKRRLTRHSDLVSVLSLPDDRDIPNTFRNMRSRPSLRKARGGPNNVSAEDLLREFTDDENFYLRELKTLVDGVVPVLLTQVPADYFDSPGYNREALAKAVVGMGVALDKMRNAHRKAPQTDMRRLAHWAHGVVPIYNTYLSCWRLGFEDLVVNLAPAEGIPDDEDSLLNAMPRNENGDIVNEAGERVDVAHLLKRPLIRLKHMVKFIKCVDSILSTEETEELVRNFDELQEKSRRRLREETARVTDEDAINTDTTRCRDLRTLGALDYAFIDPKRQVNAKDIFSLELYHSNDQRLECQVELVHRDNLKYPDDPGDLLIRETGGGRRSYLLFPPITLSSLSARTGDTNNDMVIMIRGWHHDKQWHELLTLSSHSEDQILDWLDMLPMNPVPPRQPEPSIIDDDDISQVDMDVPFGARSSVRKKSRQFSFDMSNPTPTRQISNRYQPRGPSLPTTPSTILEESETHTYDHTPTQDAYRTRDEEFEDVYDDNQDDDDDRSTSPDSWMRPEPLKVTKKRSTSSYREDGAPPPPIHRTLSVSSLSDAASEQGPTLEPPIEFKSSGALRRRTSSPLKHEYLPSDGSSESNSELSYTEEEEDEEDDEETGSEDYSSDEDDDLESVDVPETEIGISIKRELADDPMAYGHLYTPRPVHSAIGQSECSLTPSNSASQAGVGNNDMAADPVASHEPHEEEPQKSQHYLATISRWSERGIWKEISEAPCSVFVTPGQVEAYPASRTGNKEGQPILAMDLTPLVLIRQSTTVDLEIRSSVQAHCSIYKTLGGGNFRFRCHNGPDCFSLYMAVHHARLNNQKFIKLENEARFRSFGERQAPPDNDGDSSSRRRGWFGRKNSYRSSVRAPSHDGVSTQTGSTSLSATSFLKRLTVSGNMTFNLSRSSVDKHQRPGSARNSLYTSDSSSYNDGATPPRSPSISTDPSNNQPQSFDADNIRIRLHLLISATKWEDHGNCTLQIRRPPPGWHQALRADHGLEKRVTVTTAPKKGSTQPRLVLDAVLGSGCFQPMGSRGIVCGIWEDVKEKEGTGAPATGPTGGSVRKWCFQCASVAEASWLLRLVHQEVQLLR